MIMMKINGPILQFSLSMEVMADCMFFKSLSHSSKIIQFYKISNCQKKSNLNNKIPLNWEIREIKKKKRKNKSLKLIQTIK